MRAMGHRTAPRAKTSDAEVLPVGVIAADHLQNHDERAVCVLRGMGYRCSPLSLARLNRRTHRLAAWFVMLRDLLAQTRATDAAFVLDRLPLPVCQRGRTNRCRTVRGRGSCDGCAANRQRFFGGRLPRVVIPQGMPVAVDRAPARLRALTPIHGLMAGIPAGA